MEEICGHLGLPRGAWFRILGASVAALDRYREGYPVERLLAEDLDLGMPEAPEELFVAMRGASRDVDDQLQLDRWIATLALDDADPARRTLRDWLRETYHTALDLFDAFPKSVPSIDVLIELLPKQKPRMYSVASSALVHPRQVRIMAGVLTVPSRDGRPRRGLCSTYCATSRPARRRGWRSRRRRGPCPRISRDPCCWWARAPGSRRSTACSRTARRGACGRARRRRSRSTPGSGRRRSSCSAPS